MIILNGVLGVVAGAVIGLFAAYLTSVTQSLASLSISALAFLAGYNTVGLFAFFDNLSNRVFAVDAPSAK
jgi:hypothetical protein